MLNMLLVTLLLITTPAHAATDIAADAPAFAEIAFCDAGGEQCPEVVNFQDQPDPFDFTPLADSDIPATYPSGMTCDPLEGDCANRWDNPFSE